MWYQCGRVYCSDASIYMYNDRLVLEYFRRLIDFRKWSRGSRFGVTIHYSLSACDRSATTFFHTGEESSSSNIIFGCRDLLRWYRYSPVMSLESSGFIENRPESVLRRVFSFTFLLVHFGLFLKTIFPKRLSNKSQIGKCKHGPWLRVGIYRRI